MLESNEQPIVNDGIEVIDAVGGASIEVAETPTFEILGDSAIAEEANAAARTFRGWEKNIFGDDDEFGDMEVNNADQLPPAARAEYEKRHQSGTYTQ